MTSQTCLPTCAWFLYDENGKPLGQLNLHELPRVGARIDAGEVSAIEELRPTCAMRRFKVVVRAS